LVHMGTTENTIKAIAYCRVSTTEQEIGGHSLDDQETVLRALASLKGWEVQVVRETGSGKSLSARPLLTAALADLDSGNAHVLMSVRLDRLSRSVADFAGLMDRAEKKGWDLHVADLGLDTSSPSGRLVAQVLAATAEHERRIIGERTKEGLRAAKAKGVRLGRPTVLPAEVQVEILQARAEGLSLRAIADALNEKGIPTAHGGAKWHASTVRAVVLSVEKSAA
jgi:DNA invertase Pin-like site-specific DNA recombinase